MTDILYYAPGSSTVIDHNFKQDQEIERLRSRLAEAIAEGNHWKDAYAEDVSKLDARLAEALEARQRMEQKAAQDDADWIAVRARLAEAERSIDTLLGMIRHQRDVLRECLPYLNESMAGKRPGRSADDIRASVKALTADSAPAVMERPWQEIVKDATRYMWLRRRVDTAPAHGLYPWSDAAAMDAAIDAGMAATSQPTVAKEKGE